MNAPTAPSAGRLVADELRGAALRRIRERFGLVPTEQQTQQLEVAAGQVLRETGASWPDTVYAAILSSGGDELLDRLIGELTVGETHFFRVAPQIDALRRLVLPELVARRADERRLRIWSAGCSTGEEVYTLAILLRELLPDPAWRVDLLATDINPAALAVGREGLYGEWSFRETPEWVRERFFRQEGSRWRLDDSVRRMVRFEVLNLASGTPTSLIGAPLDLVVCRNVTIYFTPTASARLYADLAEVLAPDGWLVLGPSDPVPARSDTLEPVYLPDAVLWRRGATEAGPAARALPRITSADSTTAAPPTSRQPQHRPKRAGPAVVSRPAPRLPADELDLNRVRELERSGQRSSARELASRLAGERPLEDEAHLLLGLLHLDDGQIEAAVVSLRRAAFLNERHAFTQFSLARAYLARGEHTRARAALSHARRLLVTKSDEEAVSGVSDLLVGELRRAVETQVTALIGGEQR